MALITCPECNKQMSDKAVACPACGFPIGAPPNIAALPQEEQVIMQGLCNRVKSVFNVQNGKALLTNQRFVYLKHGFAKTLAIGLLVNLTSGDFDFDIPLSDIANIEDGRQGVSKTIIINTKSGDRYNFYFTKREEWKIALQNALKRTT